MKRLNFLLSFLVLSFLFTGISYNSFADRYDNKGKSSSSSSKEYVDCDDKLAECGDRCNDMNTWMWWKKKECEKKCQEEYYKCLQEED